jgi:Xaa-Pro aminopeptidase
MNTYPPYRITADELNQRMQKLLARLDRDEPDWQAAAIMGRINLYYLTGTMQNGLLLIHRDRPPVFWVKRSYSRALLESAFPDIRPMNSFRDAAEHGHPPACSVLIETETLPLAHWQRFNKHFGFETFQSIDLHLAAVRAVKSPYELDCIQRAGRIHHEVLVHRLPAMLREGMSEAELANDIMYALTDLGHFAVNRVRAFNAELFLGQVCFGESALVGNPFNSPGGVRGLGPAVPIFGSRERLLRRGDIVSLDTGCNVEGYHTDKTVTLVFEGELPAPAAEAHRICLEAEQRAADLLRPGAIPSEIYETVWSNIPENARSFFMGCGAEQVKFLGHGVGLEVDEYPAIAKGFDAPLEENMVIALEPKAWITNAGMVGSENTYLVTPQGGTRLT